MTARSLTFSSNPTTPKEGFDMSAQQHQEADAFPFEREACKLCGSVFKILFWLSAFALSSWGVWSLAAYARHSGDVHARLGVDVGDPRLPQRIGGVALGRAADA
jgi:hypothetical protein